MKLITKDMELQYGKKILFNEKLANYSWFNLGGLAEVFFKPKNIEDIIFFFKKNQTKKDYYFWSWIKYLDKRRRC